MSRLGVFTVDFGQKIKKVVNDSFRRAPFDGRHNVQRRAGAGQFRMATVVEAPSAAALDTDEVAVHRIRLNVSSFPEVVGVQPLAVDDLSGDDHVFFAGAPPGVLFEVDDIVQVEWWAGQYWILGGGGEGSVSIWFQIVEVLCDPNTNEKSLLVEVERVAPPCGSVPEIDAYGQVEVFDDGFRCILEEYTKEELEGDPNQSDDGLRGKATYSSVYPTDAYDGCEGQWTLDGLCNPPGCIQ